MTAAAAHGEVLKLSRAAVIAVAADSTYDAQQTMRSLGVFPADVRYALATCTHCAESANGWLAEGGTDADDEPLSVLVALDFSEARHLWRP